MVSDFVRENLQRKIAEFALLNRREIHHDHLIQQPDRRNLAGHAA